MLFSPQSTYLRQLIRHATVKRNRKIKHPVQLAAFNVVVTAVRCFRLPCDICCCQSQNSIARKEGHWKVYDRYSPTFYFSAQNQVRKRRGSSIERILACDSMESKMRALISFTHRIRHLASRSDILVFEGNTKTLIYAVTIAFLISISSPFATCYLRVDIFVRLPHNQILWG